MRVVYGCKRAWSAEAWRALRREGSAATDPTSATRSLKIELVTEPVTEEASPSDSSRVVDDDRRWLYFLASLVVGVGVVVLLGSIPAPPGAVVVTAWPSTLAPAGATLVVGGVAGLVALTASGSWRKQRARDEIVERERRDSDRKFEAWKIRAGQYDTIAVSVLKQFVVEEIDKEAMAADRARAVLWGSSAVVEALETWDVEAERARTRQVAEGREQFNDAQKGDLWSALATLIRTMRSELPGDLQEVLPNRRVLRAIFSDFRQLDDEGKLPESAQPMAET